jgi:hypothetical protein
MLNIVLLCVCFVVCFSFNCFVVGLSVFKLLFSVVVIVVCCVVCCCFVWGVELAGSRNPGREEGEGKGEGGGGGERGERGAGWQLEPNQETIITTTNYCCYNYYCYFY